MRSIFLSRNWFAEGAVIVAALSLAMTGCSRTKSADVWPKYEAETTTTYEILTRAQANQAVMMTAEHGAADTMAVRFRVRVISVRLDGGAEVDITIERLMHRTLGESRLHVNFDSDRGEEENAPKTLLSVYAAVMNSSVRCAMNEQGEVTTVSGLDAVESALEESRDGDHLGGVFREIWWSGLAESVFLLGSHEPRIRVGDSWSRTRTETQDLFMTLSELTDSTVMSVTDERVEIESSGTFTVDMSKDAFASIEGGSIDEQAITSRVVWDREHGRLSELNEERLLQLSQTWQGMEMARRFVVTRTIKRISGAGGPE